MSNHRHAYRVVYVVTHAGDLGPIRVEELADLLESQRIAAEDHIRSAFGVRLGTVEDVISGRVKVGSDAVLSAKRMVPEGAEMESGRPRHLAVWLGGVTIALLAVTFFFLGPVVSDREPSRISVRSVAAPDVLGLTLSHDDTASGAVIHVNTKARANYPIDIRLSFAGDADLIRSDPPGSSVSITPGSTGVSLSLSRVGNPYRDRLVIIKAEIIQGGETSELRLLIPAVPLPSIAWDALAPSGTDLSENFGWGADDWSPSNLLRRVPQRIEIPGTTTPNYHAFLQARASQWAKTSRRLARPFSKEVIWMSFLLQGVPRSDGVLPWIGVYLKHGDRKVFRFGACRIKNNSQMSFSLTAMKEEREDSIKNSVLYPTASIRAVICLDLTTPEGSARGWIDPPHGSHPPPDSALKLSSFPRFECDAVEIAALDGSGIRLSDLRIGRSWKEVDSIK